MLFLHPYALIYKFIIPSFSDSEISLGVALANEMLENVL